MNPSLIAVLAVAGFGAWWYFRGGGVAGIAVGEPNGNVDSGTEVRDHRNPNSTPNQTTTDRPVIPSGSSNQAGVNPTPGGQTTGTIPSPSSVDYTATLPAGYGPEMSARLRASGRGAVADWYDSLLAAGVVPGAAPESQVVPPASNPAPATGRSTLPSGYVPPGGSNPAPPSATTEARREVIGARFAPRY